MTKSVRHVYARHSPGSAFTGIHVGIPKPVEVTLAGADRGADRVTKDWLVLEQLVPRRRLPFALRRLTEPRPAQQAARLRRTDCRRLCESSSTHDPSSTHPELDRDNETGRTTFAESSHAKG